jgi:hypothetical protein
MGSNRKHGAAALRFAPVAKACLLCLFIGGSGIGYVWQKEQISRLGQQLEAREKQLQRLINENEQRRKHLAKMRLPSELEIQIRKLNLGLGPPQPGQVLRLTEPRPEPPAGERPGEYQYASGNADGAALQ